MKNPRFNVLGYFLLLIIAAFGSACSKTTAQNPDRKTETVRTKESPTPAYKPLKRESRDVIKTESKTDTEKVRTK